MRETTKQSTIPRGHDDDQGLLFPNHPPEITASLREWTLSTDKRVLLLVTVDKVRIYVIGRWVSVHLRKANSTVVVAKHIGIAIF